VLVAASIAPGVALAAVACAAACAWLGALVWPPSRAVRVRNAFLLRRGATADFDWTPQRVPPGFALERGPVPAPIREAVAAAGIGRVEGDWARALALETLLVKHARHGGAIQADLATTWRGIVAGRGYCADYVRAYLAAAFAAGLFCRQWAFSFDGFGGHGHTVVEVWDAQRGAWAFLDVHNNVYAVRAGDDVPLDALALRDAVARSVAEVEFRRAGDGRLGWPHFDKLADYYRRGSREWYLWWGNDVASRDRGGRWSHRLRSALGRLPAIVALVTPDNEVAVTRMERLRGHVRLAAAAVVGSVLLLAGQIALHDDSAHG